MPRIAKRLPTDRARYSFGDLVYWHLFKFGTRPNSHPGDAAGRVWEPDAICTLLDITHRTLRNWIADKHLPDSITPLSGELFGDNPAWNDARFELQTKFEEGWAAKRAGSRPPNASATEDRPQPDPKPSAQAAQEEHRFGPIEVRPPERLRPIGATPPPRRLWQGRALAAGVVGFLAVTGLVQFTRKIEPTNPAPQKNARVEPTPALPAVVPQKEPPVAMIAPPPAQTAAPLPPVPEKVSPPAEPPSLEDQKADQLRRMAEKLIKAREAAHDNEMRRKEDEARKRDADLKAAASLQDRLEEEARTVAGLGYRLRENTSAAAKSFRFFPTSTVSECALGCIKSGCDGFSWHRDQYPANSAQRRTCYLFKQPFEIANYPGYTFGTPNGDPLMKTDLVPNTLDRPVRLAQAGPPKEVQAPADDVLRCAGGPVKVSGFKLTCDRTLGGGTILKSHRLSYTVANINECAAKCRPISECVGFTFNSGDPPGQHACIIFGPTPEGRVSKGWVSGVR